MYNTEARAAVSIDDIIDFKIASAKRAKAKSLILLKKGIWLYFWLLLVEGGLRKWVLPGLATPLLLVRDPVAIWLVVYASLNGFFRSNFFVVAAYMITAAAVFFTMLTGHGDLFVALYGARITVVHLPLVFLIGQVFTIKDVEKMGVALLWSALFQTLIATLQFYSPQSAWINKGLGGEEVKGFTGGLEFSRPPGTFSFTNGLSAYYGLVTPFVYYFWIKGEAIVKKSLLFAATIALIIAIPISISRTLFYEVAITGVFSFVIASQRPKMIGPFIGAAIGLIALFVLLSNLSFFQTGVDAFTDRFTTSTDLESGSTSTVIATSLSDRFFGGMITALQSSNSFPFFGIGLGFGTNAGAQFLTGRRNFTISEGEWGRIIGEMGVLLGLLLILLRSYISLNVFRRAYNSIKQNNFLPWLLVSFSFIIFIQGQWAQPTALGMAIVGMGLTIAAFNTKTT